jgi:hypothetical protein
MHLIEFACTNLLAEKNCIWQDFSPFGFPVFMVLIYIAYHINLRKCYLFKHVIYLFKHLNIINFIYLFKHLKMLLFKHNQFTFLSNSSSCPLVCLNN